MFRTLKASEIETRVGTIKEKWLTLLLYKDARADMIILDDSVGPLNWKREHTRDNANCIISVYNPDTKEWVSKEDTGSESNTEAKKGLASDSFKRACVNWGIGRELYTGPQIKIWDNDMNYIKETTRKDKYNKNIYTTYEKFSVKSIDYTDGNITGLVIVDSKGNIIFTFGGHAQASQNTSAIQNVVTEQNNDVPDEPKRIVKSGLRHPTEKKCTVCKEILLTTGKVSGANRAEFKCSCGKGYDWLD